MTTNQNTHLGKEWSPSQRLIYMQCNESRREAARLTSPSDTQDISTTSHMDHQDDVWDRKEHPSNKRDEKLQDWSAGTEWDKVATLRTAEAFIQRTAAVIRTHRGWRPPLPNTEGVALMLALIDWEPVNSCIITAKFTTKKKDIRLNIIQCYAPTNDAEEEKKDDFCQQLSAMLDRRGAKDITILMGDFNAKISTGYEDIIGIHGLGQMNKNGERFADLCALNKLVIGGGSIFPHEWIHKATWISPNHITENQINHICISRKFRRSWRDVLVMRGADVSSDHNLLMTTVRLRLNLSQEIHQCQQHKDKVQCCTAQKQGHTSSFPDKPFKEVPAATRADRRR